jgi:hypothetical protein
MTYSKKFEKWYSKNLANRGIIDYDKGEVLLKQIAFEAWSAAAKRITARIGAINKWSDHNWQHEDVDSLQDYARELYKDPKPYVENSDEGMERLYG